MKYTNIAFFIASKINISVRLRKCKTREKKEKKKNTEITHGISN